MGKNMFTGIITGLGTVRTIQPLGQGKDMPLVIAAPGHDTQTIALGASIACSGCCLAAVELRKDRGAVDASVETHACKALGSWIIARAERSIGKALATPVAVGPRIPPTAVTVVTNRSETVARKVMSYYRGRNGGRSSGVARPRCSSQV